MTDNHVIFDEQGARYELRALLGRGGQGEVWRTADGRRVIKKVFRRGAAESLRRQLAFVRRLDLSGLHVARPIALLRAPHVGYAAEFLDEMAPLASLLAPPRSASPARWYLDTGGLRRRLRLLAHTGETLASLHARGLVYCDLSPANVFVSADVAHAEAWLIDLDNLRHDSVPSSAIYTPGYGAPEVLDGRRGSTSLSDAWSFAVLVIQTLRLVHPFVGDLVADGDADLEVEAFAAKLPWIEHATDDRNRATAGVPREHVVSERLLELARRAFESPRHDVALRPSVSAWVERLHAAADQTLRCNGCLGTFFATAPQCPWCERPREHFVRGIVRRWEPGHGVVMDEAVKPVARLVVSRADSVELTARLTDGRSGLGARAVTGTLAWRERGVFVRTARGTQWFTSDPTAPTKPARPLPVQGITLPTDGEGWRIHFGPLDAPHRVATVKGTR